MSEPICCTFCLSTDPSKVGVEKATGKVCRNEFHCPVPDAHGNPFRYCPYCDWREDESKEPPAGWAVGWSDLGVVESPLELTARIANDPAAASDSDKLRNIANWIDLKDSLDGRSGTEAQDFLRNLAARLEVS